MRTWGSPLQRALFQAKRFKQDAALSDGKLFLVGDKQQFSEILGKIPQPIAGILAVEGAQVLNGKLQNINRLHQAGIRMIGPTHFFDTEIGGSQSGECQCGLSPFGRRAMKRIRELGMIVDLAHASHMLIRDIVSLPDDMRPPILLSHTGLSEVCLHPRNYPLDLLRLIVQRGGLIGVALFRPALCGEDTVMSFVRTVSYLKRELGINSVALGSDWDGAVHMHISAADAQVLAEALRVHTNFTEDDVRKIMYENVHSFFDKHFA